MISNRLSKLLLITGIGRFIIKAPELIHRTGADATSGLIHPRFVLLHLIHIDNLILGIRKVKVSPVAELVVQFVVPFHLQFIPFVLHFTHIDGRQHHAHNTRQIIGFGQDILSMFHKVIGREIQAVVEDTEIHTVVLFQ